MTLDELIKKLEAARELVGGEGKVEVQPVDWKNPVAGTDIVGVKLSQWSDGQTHTGSVSLQYGKEWRT